MVDGKRPRSKTRPAAMLEREQKPLKQGLQGGDASDSWNFKIIIRTWPYRYINKTPEMIS